MLEKLMIKNVKTKKPSYTTTMVVVAFGVINLKLLLSGIEVMDKVKMSEFSGTEYAAALASIGGIYLWNKKVKNPDQGDT